MQGSLRLEGDTETGQDFLVRRLVEAGKDWNLENIGNESIVPVSRNTHTAESERFVSRNVKSWNRYFVSAVSIGVAASLCCVELCAQKPAPKFEVASIKPMDPSVRQFGIEMTPGGRMSLKGASVRMLIMQAYDAYDFQISGGPDWINTDRFEIEAKPESGTQIGPGDIKVMMRGLLEDRFHLKLGHETKEMPIYALVVAKGGPKLKATEAPADQQQVRMGRGRIDLQSGTTEQLALQLSRQIGRTVLDRTGLTGSYDLSMQWTPGQEAALGGPPRDGEADLTGPTIFTALQEQLGLKLESTKGPVALFVVEHVEKPSEN